MKQIRLGATVAHLTLVIASYYFNLPSPFLFAFTILSFSPIWIPFVKFALAIAKNTPHITISYIVTYAIAIIYYFYQYGISFESIFYLMMGVSIMLLVIFLYNLTFNYLDNEGVKSYRWKAILSYSIATTFGLLYLLIFKSVISLGFGY